MRRCVNVGFGVGGIATLVLVGHDLLTSDWPFPRTSIDLAAAAGALALTAAAPKALGWQRLFRGADRPASPVGALVLSLLLLGMIDAGAPAPFAVVTSVAVLAFAGLVRTAQALRPQRA